ncbi:sensor histidine kinase [Actinoplanes sp. GCM10030250]|uniref:sensor histidine kinase n=1 Tax=Actinoplanes sp. GCM10030250 TaxID=3273376 RepID=UPI00361FE108
MPVPSLLLHGLGPVPQRAVDVVLAGSAGMLCLYAAADTPPAALAEPAWLTLLAGVAMGAPLLARRSWPRTTAVVVGLVAGVLLATGLIPDYASPAPVAVAGVALYTVGRLVPGREGATVAVLASAPLLAGTTVGGNTAESPGPAGLAFAALILGASWAVGWTLRERRRHAEMTAAQSTARAVAEERLRIAREMHDAVGHSLSLITVQASVAGHVARQRPEEAVAALAVIEQAGRSALTELRRAVGALRTEPEYHVPPTLSDLGKLADQAQSAGVSVLLDVRADDSLPDGLTLAAYRIVQESLTNVVRHAAPTACRVEVECVGSSLRIEVTDDGTRRPAPAADGTGLAGMRERVAAYDGTFSAGPRAGGGFAVVATLPYGAPS